MANPDLILHNGTIYTRTGNERSAQALAIWKGQVADVGANDEILKLKARSVKTLDLKGRTIIPGLIDSHVHLLGYGMLSKTLDLISSQSIEEIKRSVSKKVARAGPDTWVIGRGWDQERLREHRLPVREDFDFTSNPVFLRRVCGHVAVANSAALSLAKIDEKTPDPVGGVIEKNEEHRPTGVLKESAIELVQRTVPKSEDAIEKALVSASKRLLRLGLTSLHCIVEDILELKALRRLCAEGRVKQSIYAILPLRMLGQARSLGLATEKNGGIFRVGGVKVFLDGSLGARTAALREPYSDSPASGIMRMEQSELERVRDDAVQVGLQLTIHAIGDKAVEQAVNVLEETNRIGAGGLRHRIEHVSLAPHELLSRMSKHEVLASVQPSFIYTDTWAAERLGRARLHSLYPFRAMIKARVRVAAGSDCPAASPDPFLGVWSAVARPGLPPDERLSVSEALSWYTEGSAFASFAEKREGTLEPGKRANLIILDKNPFQCPQNSLRSMHVVKTMIDGEFVT